MQFHAYLYITKNTSACSWGAQPSDKRKADSTRNWVSAVSPVEREEEVFPPSVSSFILLDCFWAVCFGFVSGVSVSKRSQWGRTRSDHSLSSLRLPLHSQSCTANGNAKWCSIRQKQSDTASNNSTFYHLITQLYPWLYYLQPNLYTSVYSSVIHNSKRHKQLKFSSTER